MATQNDVLSSTLRVLRDRVVDQTFKSIPLLDAINTNKGIEVIDGGAQIDHPVILAEHSNITELKGGYEAIDMSIRDIMKTASFGWCDYIAPVAISGAEKRSNKGKEARIRILDARMKSVMGMLKREWNKQVVLGTSPFLTKMNTFNGEGTTATAPFSLGGTPAGFFEIDSFGNQSNTVGGISKSAYPNAWQNQVATASGNFANNGEEAMSELCIETQQYAPEGDIDIILASKNSYRLYRKSLTSREQYSTMDEIRSTSGKLGLLYNGAMMYIDSNLGFSINGASDVVSMYFLNSKMFSVYFDKDAYFNVGDLKELDSYDVWMAKNLVRTQLAITHLASHGVLINAEA